MRRAWCLAIDKDGADVVLSAQPLAQLELALHRLCGTKQRSVNRCRAHNSAPTRGIVTALCGSLGLSAAMGLAWSEHKVLP